MNNDKTTFIRATLKNSLEKIKQSGLPVNTLSQVKIVFSNDSISYDFGSVKEEILLYIIANNKALANDDDALQEKQDMLIRDAKMIALCLAYLPRYGKGSREEQLYANEWRRLEREINLQELNEMQNDYHG